SSRKGRACSFELQQLCPDRFGVWVAQVVEYCQRLMPGRPGAVFAAGRQPGIAKMGEYLGCVKQVPKLPVQGKGPLVAFDRIWIIAEMMVGKAETVPGSGLSVPVVEVVIQDQGLLAGVNSVPEVAHLGLTPANVVERASLPGLVADSLVDI